MTKEYIEQKLIQAFRNVLWNVGLSYSEPYYLLESVYIEMFGKLPNYIFLTTSPILLKDVKTDSVDNKHDDESEELFKRYEDIIGVNTFNKCRQYLDDNRVVYVMRTTEFGYFLVTENEEILIMEYSNLSVLTRKTEVPEWITNNIVFKEKGSLSYEYLVFDSDAGGFTTMSLKMQDKEVDVKANYNDDLPDKEIKEFIKGDESGIIILHGDPGTGKSTYIRHLISQGINKFLYLDQSSFNSITDASFIRTLIKYANNVIILEDCEKLLKKRDEDGDSHISALLNLTDGLLGDSFKFKVLCTFNADLDDIDDALLRKGRLKVKYLFDKLNKDKAKKLAGTLGIEPEEITEDMTLADLYGFNKKVDFDNKKEKKRIGF